MSDIQFRINRIKQRWKQWEENGAPDTEDIPRDHIEDCETVVEAWINEHEPLRSIGIKLAAFCIRLIGNEYVPTKVAIEAMELAQEFRKVAGIE